MFESIFGPPTFKLLDLDLSCFFSFNIKFGWIHLAVFRTLDHQRHLSFQRLIFKSQQRRVASQLMRAVLLFIDFYPPSHFVIWQRVHLFCILSVASLDFKMRIYLPVLNAQFQLDSTVDGAPAQMKHALFLYCASVLVF